MLPALVVCLLAGTGAGVQGQRQDFQEFLEQVRKAERNIRTYLSLQQPHSCLKGQITIYNLFIKEWGHKINLLYLFMFFFIIYLEYLAVM